MTLIFLSPEDSRTTENSVLGGCRGSAGARRGCGRDGDRSGGGNAPLLFEHLRQLSRFHDGQRREFFNNLFQFGH
jgi:hypothetical protein